MTLEPTNPEDRELFYKVGRTVRENYNSSISPLWNDSLNLEEISNIKQSQLKIFAKDEGRIGVFKLNDNLGAIGWYECSKDFSLSSELLIWARNQLQAMNVKNIVGPINGSTWYNYRFNLSSDSPLFIGEPHQPEYYVKQWESFGFEISEEYETSISQLKATSLPQIADLENQLISKGLTVEKFSADLNSNHREGLYNLLIESFLENKIYKKISLEDYTRLSKDYPKVLDQEHSFVIFDKQKPVGFIGCILDVLLPFYAKSTSKDSIYSAPKLIIKTLVTHPELQSQGLAAILVQMAMRSAVDHDVHEAVHALMHKENPSATSGKRIFDAKLKNEYALFNLKLNV